MSNASNSETEPQLSFIANNLSFDSWQEALGTHFFYPIITPYRAASQKAHLGFRRVLLWPTQDQLKCDFKKLAYFYLSKFRNYILKSGHFLIKI